MEELMTLLKKLRYAGVVAGMVAGTTIGALSVAIPSARAQNPPAAAINDEASAALARTSKTLTATQFSFRSRTMRAYAGPNSAAIW
jgi:hypothetical protein